MKWSPSVLSAVGVVFFGCSLFYALKSSEPVYEGKSFSVWAEDLYPKRLLFAGPADFREFSAKRDQANQALRQMGTNALTCLLKMLHYRDSSLKIQFL